MNWLQRQLHRLREWACEDFPPDATVERAMTIGVTALASPLGPPRVVVRFAAADGTERVIVLAPPQAGMLARQLNAAVYAGTPAESLN